MQAVPLHLVTLPLPPATLSTPQLHVASATPPSVHLLFTPTGCCAASSGTLASHPPACPPLCLRLLLRLVLFTPSSCRVVSHQPAALWLPPTLHCLYPQWLVVVSSSCSVICHPLLSSFPLLCIVRSLTLQMRCFQGCRGDCWSLAALVGISPWQCRGWWHANFLSSPRGWWVLHLIWWWVVFGKLMAI